jgi:hypothetical protein
MRASRQLDQLRKGQWLDRHTLGQRIKLGPQYTCIVSTW